MADKRMIVLIAIALFLCSNAAFVDAAAPGMPGSGEDLPGQGPEYQKPPPTEPAPPGEPPAPPSSGEKDGGKVLAESETKPNKDPQAEIKVIDKPNSQRAKDTPTFAGWAGGQTGLGWMKGLTENPFSGLAGYSYFYQDQAWYQSWRETVNEYMCSVFKIGGINCWVSEICKWTTTFDDFEYDDTAFTTNPRTGVPEEAAHIEGERSMPISFFNETGNYTFYYYKVTYFLHDQPDGENTHYTITLIRPDGGVAVPVNNKLLEDGESAGASGINAKRFKSVNYYSQIKMNFRPGIREYRGGTFFGERGYIREVTNDITGGGAGGPTAVPAEEEGAGGAGAVETEDWDDI